MKFSNKIRVKYLGLSFLFFFSSSLRAKDFHPRVFGQSGKWIAKNQILPPEESKSEQKFISPAHLAPPASKVVQERKPNSENNKSEVATNVEDDKSVLDFKTAYVLYEAGQLDKAKDAFHEYLKVHQKNENATLEVYAHYYLALMYKSQSKIKEAEEQFNKILEESPNLKMEMESKINLGEMAIAAKNFDQARSYFDKMEKRTRNTESYPSVLYNFAILEKNKTKNSSICFWLKALYSKYPTYEKIKDWTADLKNNIFEGEKKPCEVSADDFKTRLRNLLWLGLDEKAKGEIKQAKESFLGGNAFELAQIDAQFQLQQGDVLKAYENLKPFYKSNKNNFSFLLLYGTVAARSGDNQIGIDSHYHAYKLRPNTKEGKQALYQAAFISYQSMDYDGALSKFQEYKKKYPKSSLAQEADWHSAWIKYLKGDYEQAYSAMNIILKLKRKGRRAKLTQSADRIQYWMGMTLLRMQKYEKAKSIFVALTKDKSNGYYSIVANYRLRKMNASGILTKTNSDSGPQIKRFSMNEYMIPSIDSDTSGPEDSSEVAQNKIDDETTGLEANQEAQSLGLTANSGSGESADNPNKSEQEEVITFKDPALTQRFARARDLMIVGLNDWARWDLFDIERKTRNKEYLRILMSEYVAIENYHRSSYIAQTAFGGQRAQYGIDGVRFLWELSYPRAYEKYVEKYSQDFSVPKEFVWSIMRTESQFRKDALSPAGAIGLMQVMPLTGYRVAKILKDNSFNPQLLLQPEVSVKIGSRYLKRLMDQFDGLLPLVAASYNAGPHRVTNWLGAFGNLETDEFIEHIPFIETRNYVKKVISSCSIYTTLYSSKRELFGYLADMVPFKAQAKNGGHKEVWDGI